MNIDVTKCVAEVVASDFGSTRHALRRYSVTVVLHSPDRTQTRRCTGHGADRREAELNAIGAGLKAWGWESFARMDVVEEVRISSTTLPDGYGAPYLTDADACMAPANRMPAESQAYKDMMAVAEWYERQYLAVRYEYLRDH